MESKDGAANEDHRDDRRFRGDGWTAQVFKNEDDEGWAVSMTRDGEQEPALVVPWTMGRDKKNPKPLDKAGFTVLLKNATETRARHEQQRLARLHKSIDVRADGGSVRVELQIVEDEDDPHATLAAYRDGEQLARVRVDVRFKLSQSSAAAWIASDYAPSALQ
jgi:hypothetical protein